MNVKEILVSWLTENKYDGFAWEEYECYCDKKDLISCARYCGECKPGIKVKIENDPYCKYKIIPDDKK